MTKLPTQFSGESNWDAIINDNSLDIVEEESFLQFVVSHNASQESSLDVLADLYEKWKPSRG